MSWWGYVEKVTGRATQTEIAERTGLSQGGINRWKTTIPKAESVAQFARAYDRPVPEAFVAAGFMTASEAGVTQAPSTLDGIPAEDLLKELGRRLGVGSS